MNGFRSFSTSRIRILVFSKNIKAENERKTRLPCLSQVMTVLPGLNISRASVFLPISIGNTRCPWSMFMAARVSRSFGQPLESDIQWELNWWVQYTWISIRCFGRLQYSLSNLHIKDAAYTRCSLQRIVRENEKPIYKHQYFVILLQG